MPPLIMLFLLLCQTIVIHAQYEVPEAKVEVFSPKGFKVSIPDHDGIRLFAFHGKINEELNGREAGTFSRDVLKAKDGRWTFYEPYAKLKVGDKIHYWTYVEHLGLGYPNDDQLFEVKELIEKTNTTTTTAAPVTPEMVTQGSSSESGGKCQPTATTYKNGKATCKGKLLFSDTFTTEVREKWWTIAQQYASAPDYEFVLYVNRPETIKVANRTLKIKPILSEDLYGSDFIGSAFDLGENCTGTTGSLECALRPDGGFIQPPVVSSMINSKNKFSFKYGSIEIRAKLPEGDWIYPELYLNSANGDYGPDYESGQIRVAFLPGNTEENNVLYGGVILGSSSAARSYAMKSVRKQSRWSNEFHKFKVEWKTESISVAVDDKVYGTIYPPTEGFDSLSSNLQIQNAYRWKSGTKLAPFDKEMYITLGVGVGGFNFEDRSDGRKPWKNGARSSMKDFYNARSKWFSTWSDKSTFEVDYIKVWAL